MVRYILAVLAVTACVTITHGLGPLKMTDILTGAWIHPKVQSNKAVLRTTSQTITQQVDNFDLQNEATFEQRYFSHEEHFQAGGPIYVILGSQRPVSQYDLGYALISSVARSERGSVYALENRYFGDSIPTANLSVENLKYLTVEQSLADAAHFISHIKSVTPGAQNSPVIVSGQHYGGGMAIWFRQKYPHLAAGAWGSSAPVQALQNNQQYKVNAGETIRSLAGDECYNAIEAGFSGAAALAQDNKLAELGQILNVCEEHDLETPNDVAMLFLMMSEFFTSISNFRPLVGQICDVFLNTTETHTPVETLSAALAHFFDTTCIPVDYDRFIADEMNIELDHPYAYYGVRALTYQMCNQVGWFATSEAPNQPFGSFFPLSFFTEMCTTIFNEAVANHAIAQANQDRFNVEHGGLTPVITNALFTHGSHDPYRTVGVLEDLNESAVVISITGGGLAYDFNEISEYDDQEVINAKLDIMAVIRSWTNSC